MIPAHVLSVPVTGPEFFVGQVPIAALCVSAQNKIWATASGGRSFGFRTLRCSASNLANDEPPGRPRRPARNESSIPTHFSSVPVTCPDLTFGQSPVAPCVRRPTPEFLRLLAAEGHVCFGRHGDRSEDGPTKNRPEVLVHLPLGLGALHSSFLRVLLR